MTISEIRKHHGIIGRDRGRFTTLMMMLLTMVVMRMTTVATISNDYDVTSITIMKCKIA